MIPTPPDASTPQGHEPAVPGRDEADQELYLIWAHHFSPTGPKLLATPEVVARVEKLLPQSANPNFVRDHYVRHGFAGRLPAPVPEARTLDSEWLTGGNLSAHDLGRTWNGWAVPYMTAEQLEVFRKQEPVLFEPAKEDLCEGFVRIHQVDGVWSHSSWDWDEKAEAYQWVAYGPLSTSDLPGPDGKPVTYYEVGLGWTWEWASEDTANEGLEDEEGR